MSWNIIILALLSYHNLKYNVITVFKKYYGNDTLMIYKVLHRKGHGNAKFRAAPAKIVVSYCHFG
jgi:hypothetical protein